jgi:Protein of unknown function (DUF664)
VAGEGCWSRSRATEALGDGGLDQPDQKSPLWQDGARPSLRWIVCHMIEEYAQHDGHADLLRASMDGQTGSRDAEAVGVLVIDRFSAQLQPFGCL